jgi:hypothetical protein
MKEIKLKVKKGEPFKLIIVDPETEKEYNSILVKGTCLYSSEEMLKRDL